MEIKHKIWVENDGKTIFGPGRDILFKAIDECHSLNAAAKKLGMSYRPAWGRVMASEKRLGLAGHPWFWPFCENTKRMQPFL